jgi:hypothetical protein
LKVRLPPSRRRALERRAREKRKIRARKRGRRGRRRHHPQALGELARCDGVAALQ